MHSVVVSLSVKPSSDIQWKTGTVMWPKFCVTPSKDSALAERPISRYHLKAVENGITSGLSKGKFCNVVHALFTLKLLLLILVQLANFYRLTPMLGPI